MEPFLGQIIQVGFNYAPNGWATCSGQIISISQNNALFALLGTMYGGNGQTTFALPDLQGRVIVGTGTSNTGAGSYTQGEVAGTTQITLTQQQMPTHTHGAVFTPTGGGGALQVTVNAIQTTASTSVPANGSLIAQTGTAPASPKIFAPAGTGGTQVPLGGVSASGGGITGGSVTVATAGNSQPFPILQPYLSVLNCISLQGVYPSRS